MGNCQCAPEHSELAAEPKKSKDYLFTTSRNLSLPKAVVAAGGLAEWNQQHIELDALASHFHSLCKATTKEEALKEVTGFMALGHNVTAYVYMRMLYNKNMEVYYATLLAQPSKLLPVVYTPTVGEACQKFGKMPLYRRGCYVSISDRGNLKQVLQEYAAEELSQGPDGRPLCDCIVFSDGGRILGLGDLAAWGMGIPIGKLDLYTVCAGVNPYRTIPVIIDAGCTDVNGNTDKVVVRDSPFYTGLKQDRVKEKSAAGTLVNSAYYGKNNMIEEFMQAAVDVFGKQCLLQFEDFNSNDAFPLLATYRDKFLTYNDDIQGTAAVAVAALLGAIKVKDPTCKDLIGALKKETFLFHGAGSANLGALALLANEAGVPKSQLFVTNSKGIIWKSEDGTTGSYRNDEQKEFAQVGEPAYDSKDLVTVINNTRATCIIGAVGRDPGCFTRSVVEAMVETNKPSRPVIFALSNPKTQAEITSENAYCWSQGAAIYGSGTAMEAVQVQDKLRTPGQVNNVYIFPGMSMGAICCKAKTIPERLFMVAAEAVANCLSAEDLAAERVVPNPDRIREVGTSVATAVVLECQRLGIACETLGNTHQEVEDVVNPAGFLHMRELAWRL
eukprot:TRINITY_DN18477_c0_g1_i2.p1 TRINITY_DN18477_c0_g1~~TRINITY_DN18477_c0_g1_i2.p1  ORF type:complete len:631 (-),score=122.09 TRINITY_DN18477_c0_g1_i2:190-2031(-)